MTNLAIIVGALFTVALGVWLIVFYVMSDISFKTAPA